MRDAVVDFNRFPGAPATFRAFVTDPGIARACLGVHAGPESAEFAALLDRLHGEWPAPRRARSAAALRQAGRSALAAEIARPGTFLVVAGQQAGFLGGPLYTLWKALTARHEAARLSTARAPFRLLPAFSVASDDHDWREVRAACFWRAGAPARAAGSAPAQGGETVEVAPPADPAARGAAVWRARVPRDQFPAAAILASIGPDAVFAPDLARVAAAYDEGGWAAGFEESLAQVGLPGDIHVFDARDPRPLLGPVFAAALDQRETLTTALREGVALLARHGLAAALPAGPRLHLFRDAPDGRRRLVAGSPRLNHGGADVGVGGGAGGRAIHDEPEADRARRRPEDYSPDAALRPVALCAALPVAAFVLGPGEAAYHAQLGALFQALGVTRPAAVFRVSLSLLAPGEVPGAGDPLSFDRAGKGVRRALGEAADGARALRAALAPLDRAVEGSFRRLARALFQAGARYEDALAAGGRDALGAALVDGRVPQERVVCGLAARARFGDRIFDAARLALAGDRAHHHLVTLA
ncbi:MAG: bacillithiol biosynthesis BshC [Planctomycetes bacterium]|nr:bacillithiol biosynthesis BshC [Planctomycetota bacterium]